MMQKYCVLPRLLFEKVNTFERSPLRAIPSKKINKIFIRFEKFHIFAELTLKTE